MKIVCEACQAKYSIADEKVRGKVFKIRCKKCSHVIVVRGGSAEAASAAPAASSPRRPRRRPTLALDAGWHIVVDGEQVGPLSEGDIRARLARGEIDPDTYIWKEGLRRLGEGLHPGRVQGGEAEACEPVRREAGGRRLRRRRPPWSAMPAVPTCSPLRRRPDRLRRPVACGADLFGSPVARRCRGWPAPRPGTGGGPAPATAVYDGPVGARSVRPDGRGGQRCLGRARPAA